MLGKHEFRKFNTSFLEVFSVIQMGVVNILVYNLFPLLNRVTVTQILRDKLKFDQTLLIRRDRTGEHTRSLLTSFVVQTKFKLCAF